MIMARAATGEKGCYLRLADEDLMVLVGGGDPRAFAALYDRYLRLAYSVAHKLCALGRTSSGPLSLPLMHPTS
jgi:hypothetical protein